MNALSVSENVTALGYTGCPGITFMIVKGSAVVGVLGSNKAKTVLRLASAIRAYILLLVGS